jgi:hypothetical protein
MGGPKATRSVAVKPSLAAHIPDAPGFAGGAVTQAAEADGRKRWRNRSGVSVRVPRGGSPMVSFMPAAA